MARNTPVKVTEAEKAEVIDTLAPIVAELNETFPTTEPTDVAEVPTEPTTIYVSKRLRLAVGAYSKIGGVARFHVHADGSFTYENSRGELSPMTGRQVERQYGKLGFCHLNGFDEPLVRATREPASDAEKEARAEMSKLPAAEIARLLALVTRV